MEAKNFKNRLQQRAAQREENEAVAREYLKATRPDLYRDDMTIHNGNPADPLCTAMLDTKNRLYITPGEDVTLKLTGYGVACRMYPEAPQVEVGNDIYVVIGEWADGVYVLKYGKTLGNADVSFRMQRAVHTHEKGRYFLDNRQRVYFA